MNTEKRISRAPITMSRIPRIALFVLVAVVLVVSVAVAAVTNSVTIQSYGVIGMREITAASGSRSDIQAAVNWMSAVGGGTVYIPAGTFSFNDETVSIPGGVNVIGAGSEQTILKSVKPAPFAVMFELNGVNGKPTRISGIGFQGLVTSGSANAGWAIYVAWGINFRIDNNTFVDFPGHAITVGSYQSTYTQPRGVIDHNSFDNPYKITYGGVWGYGIVLQGPIPINTPWNAEIADIKNFLGKYETAPTSVPVVYAEDNIFRRQRHSPDSNQGGWFVSRNNVYDGGQYVYPVGDHAGSRGMEVYNNIIDARDPMPYPTGEKRAIGFRGGGGVAFGNVIRNADTGVRFVWEVEPNPQKEPQNIWLWNNTLENTPQYIENLAGLVENVDYFLRAPNQAQDGFTYTPYPYPHPLTLVQNP